MYANIDLTDVTLVSDDTYRRLYWCDPDDSDEHNDPDNQWKLSGDESYLVMKVIWWWKLSSDESYLVMKVIWRWKLASDESYLVMKVIWWWKLPSDESYLVMKVI